jgi:uncharacterized protein YhbP (UPF0306 family)
MLEAHTTATLATVGEDGPWAATVFFASDPTLNLYFVSDRQTRHGRDIAVHPRVAVAINADCRAWAEIRGLQITGRVEMLDGARRAAGFEHYLAKFHDLRALLEAPMGVDEETIAKRFRMADLYRVRPDWIRLIDNSRGFGYREEIVLSGDIG